MRDHQIRQCSVCRQRIEKEKLLRIAWSNQKLILDLDHQFGGRGMYVHRSISCTKKPLEVGRVQRALRISPGALGKEELSELFKKLHSVSLESALKE